MKAKQKFVPLVFTPTSLRLPDRDGEYLCVIINASGSVYCTSLNFAKKVGMFNVFYNPDTGLHETETAIEVAYWADQKFIKRSLGLEDKEHD